MRTNYARPATESLPIVIWHYGAETDIAARLSQVKGPALDRGNGVANRNVNETDTV